MFTIGNKELEEAPMLGDFILCGKCGERHKVRSYPDDKGTMTLQTYQCGGKTWLAGMDQKDIRK
jgi:hypothetical protein